MITARMSAADNMVGVFGAATLAVLVWSGSLKETPILSWLPVDATLLMSMVVGVFAVSSRFKVGPARTAALAPWVLFTLLVPAAMVSSLSTEYAQSKVAVLFTVSLLLALAPFYLLRTSAQVTSFAVTLMVIGLGITAAMVIAPTAVANSPGRFTLDGSDTIATSRMILAGAVIALVLATRGALRLGQRVLLGAVGIGQFAIALLTGSRGPFVAAIVAVIVVIVTARAYRKHRGRAIFSLVLIAAVGAWYASGQSSTAGFNRIIGMFSGDSDAEASGRDAIWREAFARIAQDPLGSGWGSFEYARVSYPHNLLLETGVEAGVIVLAVIGVLLIVTFFRGARHAVNWQETVMMALFLYGFINAMVSSDINGNRLLIVTAFAIWARRYTRDEPAAAELGQRIVAGSLRGRSS